MSTEPGQDISPAPGAALTAAWEEPRDFIEAGIELARLRAECGRLRRKLAGAAAAERERIRQLAIRNEAVCAGDEGTCCYFADLIDDGGAGEEGPG